jgi:hypothetical protein
VSSEAVGGTDSSAQNFEAGPRLKEKERCLLESTGVNQEKEGG